MDVIKKHIEFLKEQSFFCEEQLLGGQDSFKRFIYCCVEKINKCSFSLKVLYDLLEENEEIEFSIGLILRSLLMDSILIHKLKFLTLQIDEEGYESVKKKIDEHTLMFIADGTANLINHFYEDESIDSGMKQKIGAKLSNLFPNVFEYKGNEKPTIKNEFKLNLKHLYNDSNHSELLTRTSVYNLYAYYSKYDHLSHWTSFFGHISFEDRKHKVDSSIAMILYSFKYLLEISFFHTEIKNFFEPTLQNIDKHIRECYPEWQE
jgi:peptide methionine sulfoxide reductase MsrB